MLQLNNTDRDKCCGLLSPYVFWGNACMSKPSVVGAKDKLMEIEYSISLSTLVYTVSA